MRNSSLLAMEILWIVTGIICLVAGIHYMIAGGGNKIFIFVIMAVISFTFAWLRHKQRKKS
jgi:hypothetical protein